MVLIVHKQFIFGCYDTSDSHVTATRYSTLNEPIQGCHKVKYANQGMLLAEMHTMIGSHVADIWENVVFSGWW